MGPSAAEFWLEEASAVRRQAPTGLAPGPGRAAGTSPLRARIERRLGNSIASCRRLCSGHAHTCRSTGYGARGAHGLLATLARGSNLGARRRFQGLPRGRCRSRDIGPWRLRERSKGDGIFQRVRSTGGRSYPVPPVSCGDMLGKQIDMSIWGRAGALVPGTEPRARCVRTSLRTGGYSVTLSFSSVERQLFPEKVASGSEGPPSAPPPPPPSIVSSGVWTGGGVGGG